MKKMPKRLKISRLEGLWRDIRDMIKYYFIDSFL